MEIVKAGLLLGGLVAAVLFAWEYTRKVVWQINDTCEHCGHRFSIGGEGVPSRDTYPWKCPKCRATLTD